MKKTLLLISPILILSQKLFAQNIFTAVHDNDIPAVKYLLTKGVDPASKGDNGASPLIFAVAQGNDRAVKLILQSNQININAQDDNGNTALIAACAGKHDDQVAMLLNHYPELNKANKQGYNALTTAVNANDVDAVKMLLAYGVDSKREDANHKLAIEYARELHEEEIVAVLGGGKTVSGGEGR